MKKQVLPLILCFAMIFSLTVPAMAADQTTASTTIIKTVTDPPITGGDGGGSDDGEPVNSSSYEISIPASFSLDDGDYFRLDVGKIETNEQQNLCVKIDYDRTFSADGYFYLKNTQNIAQKIPCSIYRGCADDPVWNIIAEANSSIVAIYNKRSGPVAEYGGDVRIVTAGSPTTAGSASVAGTYYGVIYFTIQVLSDEQLLG